MAVTIYYTYPYWGECNGTLNSGQAYYSDPGYTQLAFVIDYATGDSITDNSPWRLSFFAISSGSVIPGNTYYNQTFGLTLNVGTGNQVSVLINNINLSDVLGIGTLYHYGTSHCKYRGTNIGSLTPTKTGYTFNPTSFNITQSPAIVEGLTASLSWSYVNISATIAGTGTISGTLTTDVLFLPPMPTYWYSTGTPTGSFYYRLRVQSNGSLGTPPPTGVENTDYTVVTYLPNFIRTNRRLVAAAKTNFYYEEI